jgi:hypothetical protein
MYDHKKQPVCSFSFESLDWGGRERRSNTKEKSSPGSQDGGGNRKGKNREKSWPKNDENKKRQMKFSFDSIVKFPDKNDFDHYLGLGSM